MSKLIIAVFIAIFLLLSSLLFVRFFLGGNEDTWICQDNEWIKHGNPQAPKPESGCGPEITPTPETLVIPTKDTIKEKTGKDGMEIFNLALENVKPQMEVRSRRIGGAAYQVPSPVRGERKEALAVRWLILAAKKRSSKEFHTFAEKLSAEIIDASQNLGGAVKKREDVHRMAEANKAFAHFRW